MTRFAVGIGQYCYHLQSEPTSTADSHTVPLSQPSLVNLPTPWPMLAARTQSTKVYTGGYCPRTRLQGLVPREGVGYYGEGKKSIGDSQGGRHMRWQRWLAILLMVTLGCGPRVPPDEVIRPKLEARPPEVKREPEVIPVDLAEIDRAITKEPAYRKTPRYCLLVFGPEAQARVWLVLDGDTLYVDRNANGDLTDAGEAVKAVGGSFNAVTITAKEGVAPDTRVEVQPAGDLTFVYCHTKGRPWQRAVVDKAGDLQFAGTRQAAPVIHFNGPLTLARRFDQPFDRGPSTTDLEVMVGTPGFGAGTFARLANGEVAKDHHPVAQIVFPTEGGPPENLHVVLDQRC